MQAVVDGFSVGDVIGVGGFSTVYLARQDQFDREVALKLLNVRLDDDRSVKRFQNECLALGRLDSHPHIADVHAAGISSQGQPYLAMRWYRNGSVADLLAAKGALSLDQVVSVGLQMSDALAAAHDLGIIHRDVKPQNILVSDRGDFALADFGVSVLEYESAATVTQAFTYDHAAPEVLELEAFGPASDQYALASTLYTLTIGTVPFPATAPAQQIRAIATTDPDFTDPRLASLAPVLQRGMAKDPNERFASMNDFAAALVASQDGSLQLPTPNPTPACETVIKDGRAVSSTNRRTRIANQPSVVSDSWVMRSPLTLPSVVGGVVVVTAVACALFRWLMFVTDGNGVPTAGEWLSFQSVLSVVAAAIAAILIQLAGPWRSIGYGVALFVLVARFKGGTGSLLTASKEDQIVDVAMWVLLLLVIAGAIVLVTLSAWRNRTIQPQTLSGKVAFWIMIGSAIGGAAYGFYVWSPTVNNVNEFAVLCLFVAASTAAAIVTILVAYRIDGSLGLLGYAGTFTAIHALFVLGATRNLTSSSVEYWYELPLLIAVAAALGFALHASYTSLWPSQSPPSATKRPVSTVDLRDQHATEAESDGSFKS